MSIYYQLALHVVNVYLAWLRPQGLHFSPLSQKLFHNYESHGHWNIEFPGFSSNCESLNCACD